MLFNMSTLLNIAYQAGQKILPIYHSHSIDIERKNDDSPVTIADKLAHRYITEQLTKHFPSIPIISEEGDIADVKARAQWSYVWLVDPLDGTKEFIQKNGEFTINIGLIKDGTPIVGVVYIPAQQTLYFASEEGAYKLTNCEDTLQQEAFMQHAQKLPLTNAQQPLRVVVSRSHSTPQTEHFIEQLKLRYKDVEAIACGSSIKMCLVAEGSAHIYPRLSGSMEWDTAAGEAIVTFSGARVEQFESGEAMRYNKQNLLNPFHIVTRLPK